MKTFLKSLLQDESGQQSTKRIIAILGTLVLCVSVYIPSIKPLPEVISAIETIVVFCIGATSMDKITKFINTKLSGPVDNSTPPQS